LDDSLFTAVRSKIELSGAIMFAHWPANSHDTFGGVVRRDQCDFWKANFGAHLLGAGPAEVEDIHLVCERIGNSPAATLKNYAQVTEADLAKSVMGSIPFETASAERVGLDSPQAASKDHVLRN
jgi:hypothetical protein